MKEPRCTPNSVSASAGTTLRIIPMVMPTNKTCSSCCRNWARLARIPKCIELDVKQLPRGRNRGDLLVQGATRARAVWRVLREHQRMPARRTADLDLREAGNASVELRIGHVGKLAVLLGELDDADAMGVDFYVGGSAGCLRCDQLTVGLAPTRVRPCWAHQGKGRGSTAPPYEPRVAATAPRADPVLREPLVSRCFSAPPSHRGTELI